MTDKARDLGDSTGEPTPRPDPFSLEAYLERQRAEFEGGPTMAEILADMDRYRRPIGPTTDEIVNALHEGRDERGEHLEQLWQR